MDKDDVSIESLLATAADLKERLAVVEREIAQRTEDPTALATELRATRSYAVSATDADCVARATKALARYGFTVIDDVIPEAEVPALREEAEAAEIAIAENQQAVRALMDAAKARGEPPESALKGSCRRESSYEPYAGGAVRPRRPTTFSGCPNTPNIWRIRR